MSADRRRRGCGCAFLVLVLLAAAAALVAWRGPEWYGRFQHPLAYQSEIAAEARSSGVDPYLVAAIINVESKFRPGVVSRAGAVGLMQVKPSTAVVGLGRDITADRLRDPATNIRVGTHYLASLMRRYGGNTQLALAAYNAGMTNADAWLAQSEATGASFRDTIAFPETAYYVDDVARERAEYRELYPGAFSGK